jgi:hypothetical protein
MTAVHRTGDFGSGDEATPWAGFRRLKTCGHAGERHRVSGVATPGSVTA